MFANNVFNIDFKHISLRKYINEIIHICLQIVKYSFKKRKFFFFCKFAHIIVNIDVIKN